MDNDGMNAAEPGSGFRVTSTSRQSASVSPLVLRESETVRLVFKPNLVENAHENEATVNGTLCYQRKRRADEWEEAESISLSSLRAGEGVKLDLHAGEIRKLFRGLEVLYGTVRRDGVPAGTQTYIRADRGTVLADVADLLENGGLEDVLRVFIDWAQQTDDDLVNEVRRVEPETLVVFDAVVGAARLQNFLDEARTHSDSNNEATWQELLSRHNWAISQLYAAPMVMVREQAYVGGKSIDNQGGSIVDYMFRNALSANSLLVELKTPATPLLTRAPYRNRVYAPSPDLSGATQQLLQARQTLQEEYLSITRNEAGRFNIFGTKALLVIGTLPESESEQLRSFEVFRNAHRGLEIVTFDELIEKARLLLQIMTS